MACERLKQKFDPRVMSESPSDAKYTSYSVNKGEELVFCVRSKKTGKIHDLNLLMYVALHEIAHIACPEQGHTPLFKKIFAFLTEQALKLKLYKYFKKVYMYKPIVNFRSGEFYLVCIGKKNVPALSGIRPILEKA